MSEWNIAIAARDFRQARRKAALDVVLARFSGKPTHLLSFEEVRNKVGASHPSGRRLEEIPVKAIVGSVDRYMDFTQDFLPLRDSDEERWARVLAGVMKGTGMHPIEVYQIGEVYFVLDGNHRVSITRQLGTPTIQAYVTELHTPVPLSPDIQPDQLIMKAEYAAFLEHTHLDQLRPEADLSVTVPGRYADIEAQIGAVRDQLSQERGEIVSVEQAASHWYDEVYSPVVRTIRNQGILRDFPGRTETDLYVWLLRHQQRLRERLGWTVGPEKAAQDLASRFGRRKGRVIARLGEQLFDALTPDELEAGPPPGRWREEHQAMQREDDLFVDLLIALSGEQPCWYALDQAMVIANRENGRIHGLHVVASEDQSASAAVQALQHRFNQRLEGTGIDGELKIGVGAVPRVICDQASLTDLIVLGLAHPPKAQPLARLGSKLSTLIRRCSKPLMVVSGPATPLRRPLLAYDGSPKAREALYIAAYLVGKWDASLVVLSVKEKRKTRKSALEDARAYLQSFGIQAEYVYKRGKVPQATLETAQDHECDLILMGGYGFNPMLETVLGSAVDQVVCRSPLPMFICR